MGRGNGKSGVGGWGGRVREWGLVGETGVNRTVGRRSRGQNHHAPRHSERHWGMGAFLKGAPASRVSVNSLSPSGTLQAGTMLCRALALPWPHFVSVGWTGTRSTAPCDRPLSLHLFSDFINLRDSLVRPRGNPQHSYRGERKGGPRTQISFARQPPLAILCPDSNGSLRVLHPPPLLPPPRNITRYDTMPCKRVRSPSRGPATGKCEAFKACLPVP